MFRRQHTATVCCLLVVMELFMEGTLVLSFAVKGGVSLGLGVKGGIPIGTTATAPPRMGMFDDFFKNLDDFIDDAMDRKLAGGSTFYGERKSNFSSSPKTFYYVKEDADDDDDNKDLKATDPPRPVMTSPLRTLFGGRLSGEDLRELIVEKWGERFPVLIKRRRDALGEQRIYMVVQWKRLGKRNLNLSLEEYVAESDAVAELLTEWGVANQVRNAIVESTARPKTATQQFPGLFIPLEVDRAVIDNW